MNPDLWKYMQTRENIRLAKEAGKPKPWTRDEILQSFKFTNVKRLHDKTTQAFLRTYKERAHAEPKVALFNCAIRRFFGTLEFGSVVGWLTAPSLSRLRASVKVCPKPWTGAYVICAGAAGVPKVDVVAEHLFGMWEKANEITSAIEKTRTWRAGYEIMHTCRGFGGSGFMCKEVLQDYILWLHCQGKTLKDEATWTPVGPGARRGLNRLAQRPVEGSLNDAVALDEIVELLKEIAPKWKKAFPKAEVLTAHDVQFCLCELDKYERVRLGEGRPRSTYPGKP